MIKGICVSSGTAKGSVIVVNSIAKVNLVHEENIVVTNENSPLYSLAFMRAKAIISEKGGMLSHLAIIAREMQKPCLLSVENATKLLRDKMIVIVDCDKEEVHIIEGEY